MGDGGHVRYIRDLESSGVQCPNGGIPPRSRAFYVNIEVFQPEFAHRLPHLFRGNLCGEGCTLARSLETAASGACPTKGVSLPVRNGNDGVIERGVYMRHTVHHRLFYSFTRASFWSCHCQIVYFLRITCRGPLRVRAFVCVRCPRTGNPRRWRMPR